MKSEICYPSRPLRGFIKYFWILEADTINHEELVYPTGDMQVLFHYGNPFKMITNSGMEDQPGIALCGQVSSVMRVAANESCGVIAAVLYPYAAKFFFDFSMIEITDLAVDITGICGDSFFLLEQISECDDTSSRIRIIENYLMNRLKIPNMHHLHIMRKTIRDIHLSGGMVSLDYLVPGFEFSSPGIE